MPRTVMQGRPSHQLRSLANLLGATAGVLARRAIGRPLVPGWTVNFEIATLFYRKQFNHAFSLPSMAESRAFFDSLYTRIESNPQVDVSPSESGEPRGDWFTPRGHTSGLTMLYFHGGGYAYYGEVSRHFMAMLVHLLEVPIFAPNYRLTPEHQHPAQIEDGLAAYQYLLAKGLNPEQIVICGDSAGGHLTLMSLVRIREAGLPQPALAIALSPWTDIGKRGNSQFGNDRYDMVQGYQTLQYGQWLKGDTGLADEELSPVYQDFRATAPIYIQAGGKEVLVDMIRDFAHALHQQGASVRLDVWDHMTHEFHAYGETIPQSQQAIACIRVAMDWAVNGKHEGNFAVLPETEVNGFATHRENK